MLTMSFEIGGAPEDLARPALISYRGIEVTQRYKQKHKKEKTFIFRRWGNLCGAENVAEENQFLCSDSG